MLDACTSKKIGWTKRGGFTVIPFSQWVYEIGSFRSNIPHTYHSHLLPIFEDSLVGFGVEITLLWIFLDKWSIKHSWWRCDVFAKRIEKNCPLYLDYSLLASKHLYSPYFVRIGNNTKRKKEVANCSQCTFRIWDKRSDRIWKAELKENILWKWTYIVKVNIYCEI